MKSEKIIFGLDELPKIVDRFLLIRLKTHSIFTFQGPLGVGKTTMIKKFLACCGITDVIASPTFAYVKHYKTPEGRLFHHFDLYRLSSVNSFLDLGFDEYLYQEDSVSVIEWPEVIEGLLQEEPLSSKICTISLDYLDDDLEKRVVEFNFLY